MTLFVVDTSALVAVLHGEEAHEVLRATLASSSFLVPAPVLVEFWRVARRGQLMPVALIGDFLESVLVTGSIVSFTDEHARSAALAAERHGTGNGQGGRLNLLDLMVYGVAEVEDLPILCTGNDFASTDAQIHPASRTA